MAKSEIEMLTVKDVANYLKLGPTTIYRLLNEGKIPAFKAGKQWRVRQEDLQRYIETQKLLPRRVGPRSKQLDIMEVIKPGKEGEAGGKDSEGKGQKIEVGGQKTDSSQSTVNRKTEDRRQKADDRKEKTEDRGQKTEDG